MAWQAVMRGRTMLLKAEKEFLLRLNVANKLMKDTPAWERQDRKLREAFIRKCERLRAAASQKELSIVKRIRARMADKLLVQAERVPVLRRVMLRQHLNSPTALGASGKELLSPQKLSASVRIRSAALSIGTRSSAPPTAPAE